MTSISKLISPGIPPGALAPGEEFDAGAGKKTFDSLIDFIRFLGVSKTGSVDQLANGGRKPAGGTISETSNRFATGSSRPWTRTPRANILSAGTSG